MADYIRTVPQSQFDMSVFRQGAEVTHECQSVACVIGHCTILDKNPLPIDKDVDLIDFEQWSISFTGLQTYDIQWSWCFHSEWCLIDNTPQGACDRIEWLLKQGLPEDWYEQMTGETPLIYRTDESK